MRGKLICSGRNVVALLLCLALFLTGISFPAFAETNEATQTIVQGAETWQDAAEYICSLLGERPEDALSALKEWSYLEADVAPQDAVSAEQLQDVLSNVFSAVIDDEESLSAARRTEGNFYITGNVKHIGSLTAERLVFADGAHAEISAVNAKSLPITNAAELELLGSKIETVVIDTDQNVTLRGDSETKIGEVIIRRGGHVVLEGNCALGVVHVQGETQSLTIRSTCTVQNETLSTIELSDPDGERRSIASGTDDVLVLSRYVVSFVTEGTPIEPVTVLPDGIIDFSSIQTTCEGKVFTAWYEDAEYTVPFSTLMLVDRQMTLYARFVDPEDVVTVTFNTMGGSELAPLVFAKGEYLLSKPVDKIYTAKEGNTFCGWCIDEACEQSFAYTEPITQDMTLYAMFNSNEVQEETQEFNTAELDDADWLLSIEIVTPDGVNAQSMEDVERLITVETGSGITEPTMRMERTESGFKLFGDAYEQDGQRGFEPGSSFTIVLSEGLRFKDFDETVNTLLVSIFREQSEVVIFRDDIQYLLWDDMAAYTAVTEQENGNGEKENIPGTLLYTGDSSFEPDEIVCFYDGSIDPDEKNMERWTEGSYDGFVMFIQVVSTEMTDEGLVVTFLNANPVDYLADMDVNTTRAVNLEDMLDDQDIDQIERAISAQIRGNDELRAQMLVAVMTSQDTQDQLDALYGEGTYALTGVNAVVGGIDVKPIIKVSGHSVTAGITISLTIRLVSGAETLMTVTPSFTFTEKVDVDVQVKAGGIWIDASLKLVSTTRIKLEVTVASGDGGSDFSEALETLEELVKPDGLEGNYEEAVDGIMQAMQSIVATELNYVDLFEVPLIIIVVDFYGIVALTAEVDLAGEIGVLATFGMELVVEGGQIVGFKYDFKKMKGSSYKEKLKTRVENHVYLIGKIGVRIGIRLKLGVTLCVIAKAQIIGSVMAYAELTGMFFLNTSLLSGSSTYVGALNFEVGIDASVDLALMADFKLFTIGVSWNLWSERWPLYTTNISSRLRFIDEQPLREAWDLQLASANHRASFGFSTIPMRNYKLIDGSCQLTQALPQAEDSKITMSIQNMVVNGELLAADDPRNALFEFGKAEDGRLPGYIYLNEKIAAEYGCETVELDLVVSYLDDSPSALVKKQELVFHLSRECTLSTTTVDMQVMLYDECAHLWGLENADWDGEIVNEESFATTHLVGGLFEPTATADVDLPGIVRKALGKVSALNIADLSWTDIQGGMIQYSNPKTSAFCYISLDNNVMRYDVRPETEIYGLTFYLYARRFEIDPKNPLDSSVTYVLSYSGDPNTRFYTTAMENGAPMYFDANGDGTWTLTASRAIFDGSTRPVHMVLESGEDLATGLSVTGREYSRTNALDMSGATCALSVVLEEGVEGFTVLSPEVLDLSSVAPGTRVELEITCDEDHRNVLPIFEAASPISYALTENRLSFIMPAVDVTLKLSASKLHTVTWLYNTPGHDVYRIRSVAENELVKRPGDPSIAGMTFRGWYTDAACTKPYEFNTNPKKNITLYADWTIDVTVDFCGPSGRALFRLSEYETRPIFEGDTETDEYARFTFSTLRMDERIPEIVQPNYPGYVFMGWYTASDFSGDAVDFEKLTLEETLTLYALWAKVLNAVYDLNYDGIEKDYYTGTELKGYPLMDVPEDPTREHYIFTGWYTSPACTPATAFDPAADVLETDTRLYAGWTPVEYAIHYNLGGGENDASNPDLYTVESESITLAAPTRTGYDFIGWSQGEGGELTPEMVIAHGSSGEITLTAHWMPIAYAIKYNIRHGTPSAKNPATYTIEDASITLLPPTPISASYTFIGWIGEGIAEPVIDLVIPAGSIGERVYTAQWVTDDPDEKILSRAVDAIPDVLTAKLEDFSDGSSGKSTIAALIDEAIAKGSSGDYADAITHAETQTGERTETAQAYNYSYLVTVTYTNDNNETFTDTVSVDLVVNKKVPVLTAPTAARLLYGQSLANAALTGGTATDGETTVGGTFDWLDSTIVPKGRDNGTVLYTVVFTPNEKSAYAPAQIDIPAYTQTKLKVTIAAENRDYLPGDKSAVGSYHLCDADDESLVVTGVALVGGSYAFNDENAGVDKFVVFSGYALSDADAINYVLGNTRAQTTATIRKATPEITIQTPKLTYRDNLRAHTVDANIKWNGQKVSGTLQWVIDAEHPDTVMAAGAAEYKLKFEPSDAVNYESVEMTIEITASKLQIAKPTIAAQTYTGSKLQPDIAQSNDYTVSDNAYTNAGTHNVTLTLTDPANTCWADSSGTTVTVPFVIDKARLTRTGTLKLGSISYGQKFLTGVTHTTAMGEGKTANEAIIGVTMKLENSETTVTGNWQWVEKSGVTNTWCDAGSYDLTAQFVPTSISTDNIETYVETFEVTVEKSTPTITGTLEYWMQQTDTVARLALGIADLTSDLTVVKNPNESFANANGNVQGSWVWEDEKTIPTQSGKAYNVKFVPNDKTNYNQALYSATVTLSFFSTEDFQHQAGSNKSATGFATSKAYTFYNQDSITLAGNNVSNGRAYYYNISVVDDSVYKFDKMYLTSSRSQAQQVVPMGVVVMGKFAINENGNGFTKKTGLINVFLRYDSSDFPGLTYEGGRGFTLSGEYENDMLKYIQLSINRANILPLGSIFVYYVGGICIGSSTPSSLNAKYKVDGTTYTIVNGGVSTSSDAQAAMALSMAAPPAELTLEPTLDPTVEPTDESTTEPTTEPTEESTTEPTDEPTTDPTTDPSGESTTEPTDVPNTEPTTEPSGESTTEPTDEPTTSPTTEPTGESTTEPTDVPTTNPTTEPTDASTTEPTTEPSSSSTVSPTTEAPSSQETPPVQSVEDSSKNE